MLVFYLPWCFHILGFLALDEETLIFDFDVLLDLLFDLPFFLDMMTSLLKKHHNHDRLYRYLLILSTQKQVPQT